MYKRDLKDEETKNGRKTLEFWPRHVKERKCLRREVGEERETEMADTDID
jgi:hypothetical protein